MTHISRSVSLPDGTRLIYVESGDPLGLPTVLLHGVTDSWHSFEPLLPHLPLPLRALALTQRGHGDADRPHAGYRTRELAADVAAFAGALALGPAIVVGHSLGSSVAMRFAIDFPALTRGLVLIGAFAGYRDNPLVQDLWSSVATLSDPIDPAFAREFQASTIARPCPEEFLDLVTGESLKVPARVWQAAFAGLLEDDFGADLHRIHAPTLLIWGDQEELVPRSDQDRLLATIAGSRLVVVEGAGHAVHWDDPQRVARELATFAGSCGGLTAMA